MMGEARRRLWKKTYATAKAQEERERKRIDSAMYVSRVDILVYLKLSSHIDVLYIVLTYV